MFYNIINLKERHQMIELLLIILIVIEILFSAFIIVKMNSIRYAVSSLNKQICDIDIKNQSKTLRETVSKVKDGIVFWIKTQEIKEKNRDIQMIVEVLLAVFAIFKKISK